MIVMVAQKIEDMQIILKEEPMTMEQLSVNVYVKKETQIQNKQMENGNVSLLHVIKTV